MLFRSFTFSTTSLPPLLSFLLFLLPLLLPPYRLYYLFTSPTTPYPLYYLSTFFTTSLPPYYLFIFFTTSFTIYLPSLLFLYLPYYPFTPSTTFSIIITTPITPFYENLLLPFLLLKLLLLLLKFLLL